MLSSGMNDYSGQWAYKVGLPAKSGISGGLMVVVPNVMGIGLYSPCVDDHFNSVKSLEFIEQLVDQFCFHQLGYQHKYNLYTCIKAYTQSQYDPIRMRTSVVKNVELNHDDKMIVNLIAAQRNDVNRLMHAFLENQDLNTSGYDGTTLLHVAAG